MLKMNNAVKIRYKLKGDIHFTTCTVTRIQYENFRILPIIEVCEIMERDVSISGDEIEQINQKLVDAIKKDK
ncbi:Hypothetical protein Nlim_0729 [Candidatus Nitrosarchaeum limnium SFB1]|jgi:hypothetical protein|uniref:Nitrosopumilus output domain-containing protein n=1 Tax=Candidatus Nitrosarchaeum limnium SFB1 TaxID=886738 RepID=F3KJS1_9ARCH|nr:Hypothetical protein Nlim_0729 [Candidatus Nitrosarchaeum limnium SFB1]